VKATRWALEAGANACLVVNPYYNKPTQAGLIAHVKAVAAVGLPVMLYNIPGRSGVTLTPATIAELAAIPGVAAIKDATGNVEIACETRLLCPSLPVLSGDDGLTLPFMSIGAVGVVSVVSNLVPERLVAMVAAATKGDYAGARAIHEELYPLFKGAFIETNPVPAKRALQAVGLMPCAGVRLPLVQMGAETDAKWMVVLRAAKFLA
jgi:4-hydroxy-tetrahydrodipicolinate synthase